MSIQGQKTILPADAEFTVPRGMAISYIAPLDYGVKAQFKASSGSGNDFALNGTYDAATDANAATVQPMLGKFVKAKVSSASPAGIIVYWEDQNGI